MRHVSTGWCSWLTLTRGTLKATGSTVLLVSMSPTAISTSCTLHSVLGRKAKPCGQETIRKCQHNRDGTGLKETCVQMYGTLCGSGELKLLHSKKYGASVTIS